MDPAAETAANNLGAERALLDLLLDDHAARSPAPVFILGAPRTGSTVFYQSVCARLSLPYISNLTNDCFAATPLVGLSIQRGLPARIGFDSRYGKTDGAMQPAEGSAVMMHWFGGGHPSAVVSTCARDGLEQHLLDTLAAAEVLFGAPLVIKNAWNCFRVEYLATALPRARFLWLRRDIAAAAKSDLAARYRTRGSPGAWNSATPANFGELKRLAPTAQVVENQYEFNRAVEEALANRASGRWRMFWYEDFLADPDGALTEAASFLGLAVVDSAEPIQLRHTSATRLSAAEARAIDDYLDTHAERLCGAHRRAPARREAE